MLRLTGPPCSISVVVECTVWIDGDVERERGVDVDSMDDAWLGATEGAVRVGSERETRSSSRKAIVKVTCCTALSEKQRKVGCGPKIYPQRTFRACGVSTPARQSAGLPPDDTTRSLEVAAPMDEYSPWGGDDALPPIKPPASPPLPSFASPSAAASTNDSWGDDGGWGGATDDFSTSYGAPEVQVTTEDVEISRPSSPVLGGGWGRAESPELPPISRPVPPASHHTDGPSSPTFAGAPPRAEPAAFAQSSSPDLAPLSPSFPSEPPEPDLPEPTRKDDDDWGGHGAEVELPAIESVKTDAEVAAGGGGGWGGEQEWQPAEIPVPLPSFGHSFGGAPKPDEDEVEEEGWGGPKENSWGPGLDPPERASPGSPQADGDGQWSAAPSLGARRGKSIVRRPTWRGARTRGADPTIYSPHRSWTGSRSTRASSPSRHGPFRPTRGAPVVSRSTRPQCESRSGPSASMAAPHPVHLTSRISMLNSLLEPPSIPAHSASSDQPPITNDTPLTSLFRLTPQLYPSFRDGLDKTAVRTAETLKGTASNAYRNARFGRATAVGGARNATAAGWDGESTLGRPELASDRAQAGDEYDVDAPGGLATTAAAKSRWWGSKSEPAAPTTNMPKSLLALKRDDEHVKGTSPPVSPTARTASPSGDGQPSAIGRFFGRFRASSPGHSRSSSTEEQAEWKGDVSQLEPPVSRIAAAKEDDHYVANELGSIFGDAPPAPRQTHPAAHHEFGGLLGGLGSVPAPAVRKSTKSLDPFDPFADDDDDGGMPAALAPTPIARVLSPPVLASSSRPISPLASPSEPSAAIAAPQARTASSSGDDSFDAFFSSFSPTPAPTTTTLPAFVSPPAASISPAYGARRAVVSPPPLTSTLSPPMRASTISPLASVPIVRPASTTLVPPRSGPSPAFAPPPPPLQPVTRGFSIAPPPPSTLPVGSLRSSTPIVPSPVLAAAVAPVTARPPPPKTAGSGPLSFDDLSFFEG